MSSGINITLAASRIKLQYAVTHCIVRHNLASHSTSSDIDSAMDLPGEHPQNRFLRLLSVEAFQNHFVYKFLLGILLVAAIILMFPHPEEIQYDFNVGTVWTDNDLISPFAFPIFKNDQQYEKEKDDAVRTIDPVFDRMDSVPQSAVAQLRNIFQTLQAAAGARVRLQKTRKSDDSLAFIQLARLLPFSLTDPEWDFLLKQNSVRRQMFGSLRELLAGNLDDIYRSGLIDETKSKLSRPEIAVRRGSVEDIIPTGRIYDQTEANGLLAGKLDRFFGGGNSGTFNVKLAGSVLTPDLVLDKAATTLAAEAALEDVPRTVGYVLENERIIGKNERITPDVKLKLESFLKAKAERGSPLNESKHSVGIILQVLVILSLFTMYLFLFRKRIFSDNSRLAIIALLIVMETVCAYLSVQWGVSEPAQYLIFVPAASMLLTIIFDSRVGFYGTVTIAWLVAGIHGNDYTIALTSLVAGALSAYTVRDLRKRTQIFQSMIFIFIGYAIPMVAFSLEQFDGFRTVAMMLTFAAVNAIVSPVLTYGLLIFFERVFHVTTDLTLEELADVNHPLLQELSEKAPGTFHHSQTIGSLAEAAAEAIGANTILARVGGYYHDIGKMLKPEYFVENQVGASSRHNRLRPRMSALIIQSHVKEGIDLARQNGLPESVVAFIPQHHGTTRISYFYDKALKQAAKRPQKENIKEEDFLYPGPKPQTRETAIVMLADSVEASTRSITEMTIQRLEQSIDNMIKHRFIEGQLDECELTLRDLTNIKDAFLKILIGIHHQRITYPEPEPLPPVVELPPEAVEPTVQPPPEIVPQQPASQIPSNEAGANQNSSSGIARPDDLPQQPSGEQSSPT